ncbi:MAG: hypothetical protein GX050_00090 [Firmicutes bacterium]|nr:hypothetical protein [Bacillota bacterium]
MTKHSIKLLARAVSFICSPPYFALLVLGGALLAEPELWSNPHKIPFLIAVFLLGFLPALTAQDSIFLLRLSLGTRRKISFGSFLLSYTAFLLYAFSRGVHPLLKTISLSYFLTVVLLIIVNLFYKASGHGSAVAGPVLALNLFFPRGWGLLFIPLLAIVTWARVATKEHSWQQVLVGMALGLVATLNSFLIIRPF